MMSTLKIKVKKSELHPSHSHTDIGKDDIVHSKCVDRAGGYFKPLAIFNFLSVKSPLGGRNLSQINVWGTAGQCHVFTSINDCWNLNCSSTLKNVKKKKQKLGKELIQYKYVAFIHVKLISDSVIV